MHIWLRAETKPAEERTPLTPEFAGRLIDAGFDLTVEKSSQSAFDWQEYRDAGAAIAEEHSWRSVAPSDAIIFGLKELQFSDEPLQHRHIHFAHVYKNQSGWQQFLGRFAAGGGCLYDLEFLVEENGQRVAAFGYWAGFAGAALSLLAWANHVAGKLPVLPPVSSRPSQEVLIDEVSSAIRDTRRVPKVLVIGALGRCGRGAIEMCKAAGASVIAWDLEETKKGGPFAEILDADVFLNSVFVSQPIQPFLTTQLLESQPRKLSVICDISCDPYGDYNPIPIYNQCTTFSQPTLTLRPSPDPLYLIAIDHLPSLLPRESSEDFCRQLVPSLLQLDDLDAGVWQRAHDLFLKKMAQAKHETKAE